MNELGQIVLIALEIDTDHLDMYVSV